jgi:hypothetical protein
LLNLLDALAANLLLFIAAATADTHHVAGAAAGSADSYAAWGQQQQRLEHLPAQVVLTVAVPLVEAACTLNAQQLDATNALRCWPCCCKCSRSSTVNDWCLKLTADCICSAEVLLHMLVLHCCSV